MGTDVGDLIKKLENAECGSRELDADIWVCVTPSGSHTGFVHSGLKGLVVDMSAHSVMGGGQVVEAPPYTTSLDAALTLVPEGWKPSLLSWSVEEITEPNERVSAFVTLVSDDYTRHVKGETHMKNGATPALALCIAALKARQQSDG